MFKFKLKKKSWKKVKVEKKVKVNVDNVQGSYMPEFLGIASGGRQVKTDELCWALPTCVNAAHLRLELKMLTMWSDWKQTV